MESQFESAGYDLLVLSRPAPYSSWGGSRSQIDAAGRCIRDYWGTEEQAFTNQTPMAFGRHDG